MTFRDATDHFRRGGGTFAAVASAFGVTPNTVSRWRRTRHSEGRNTFNPPSDWPATLATLAKREAVRAANNTERLKQLVAALEA